MLVLRRFNWTTHGASTGSSASLGIVLSSLLAFSTFVCCPMVSFAEDTSKPPAQRVLPQGCNLVDTQEISVMVLPKAPVTHQSVRLLAISKAVPTSHKLTVYDADERPLSPTRNESWGVTPNAVSIYFDTLPAGTYRVQITDKISAAIIACQSFTVDDGASMSPEERFQYRNNKEAWPVTEDWNALFEDLFSVFVAKLFYVPAGASKGWRPLGTATQDPYRNILYGILGFDEDNPEAEVPVELSPDCADAPLQVRAYFAWKMGLPVLGNECVRGTSVNGPWCYGRFSNQDGVRGKARHPVARFNDFVGTTLSWKTQAGVFRTLPDDDQSVVYPIALTKDSIRPGTIFVDAGGHIILVTQWDAQTPNTMGALYGVDAHPDFTVTHKGFFKGTFVFNANVPTDGFKAFRPVVRKGTGLRFVSNEELSSMAGIPQYSAEQSRVVDKDQFYYQVQKALNPTQIDPDAMLRAKVKNLRRALEERVQAVQLGVDYMSETNWATMEMPNGPAIFQTEGPWESFSTPARDMRVFLTIDSVMSFPDEVVANPDLYVVSEGQSMEQLKKTLTQQLTEALSQQSIVYTRSDGTPQPLRLLDVINRQEALEMAYNPNDCIEIRWGAPSDSVEMESCDHHAPTLQRKRMQRFRQWFIDRRRPDQR